jgi:hypothetical protein
MVREQQCPHQTKWNNKMTGDKEGAKQMKQKAQEMSFDISWAIGKFFSSHFSILFFTNRLFLTRTADDNDDRAMKLTQHPPHTAVSPCSQG